MAISIFKQSSSPQWAMAYKINKWINDEKKKYSITDKQTIFIKQHKPRVFITEFILRVCIWVNNNYQLSYISVTTVK